MSIHVEFRDAHGTEHIYQEYCGRNFVPLHQREEIVRCRDCSDFSFDEFGGGWCNENCREVKQWNYCAWGERKERIEQ